MRTPLLAVAGICLVTAAIAAPRHVTGQAINDLVAGTIIELDTPLGTRLPVTYSPNGEISGRASRELARHLGSPSDTGKWWVASSQLCHKWNRWFNGEPQCLRLQVDGSAIQWRRQDGTSGTAIVVSRFAAATPKPEPTSSPRALSFAGASALGMAPTRSERKQSEPAVMPDAGVVAEEIAPAPAAASGIEVAQASKEVATTKAPSSAPMVRTPALLPPPAPAVNKARERTPGGVVMSVANVRTWDVLNVRQGPSPDHAIIGGIAPNSRGVLVTGPCQERWCPVAHQGVSGWVNSYYLSGEGAASADIPAATGAMRRDRPVERGEPAIADARDAPRSCLSAEVKALLARIEARFGAMRLVSTCRPGARIAGTGRISRHASGNAIDFDAGARKAAVIEWLLANHRAGGIMTYGGMDHIHVDIGPPFVSLTGRRMARITPDSGR